MLKMTKPPSLNHSTNSVLPKNPHGCPFLLLAPMEGVGDKAFRKAMASIGVDVGDIRDLPDYLKQDEPWRSPDSIMDIRERLDRRFGREAALRNTLALLAQVAQ